LAGCIWTLAGVWFVATFFSGGGPGQFDTDSMRHLAGAAALAFAYGGYFIALWATRKKGGGPPLADERDYVVSARAGQVTLVIVLTCVFCLAIGLWVAYEGAGEMPVGWMWFLAYGSVILTFVTYAGATLVLDGRMGGHG
jgi:hypothetical protein